MILGGTGKFPQKCPFIDKIRVWDE